jgi:RNA polymerase sigma-70 factor (ECF subfamily)
MKATTYRAATAASWDDDELLKRLLRREERAWREFHARFGGAIERAIQRATARFRKVQSADREEIAATFYCELYARDMRKLRCFDPSYGTLCGWAELLARRAAVDYVRSLYRRVTSRTDCALEELSCCSPDPLRQACAKDEWRQLEGAIARLTGRDRLFIELMFGQDRSSQQIANVMSVSLDTVHSKRHKIRAKLASALQV